MRPIASQGVALEATMRVYHVATSAHRPGVIRPMLSAFDMRPSEGSGISRLVFIYVLPYLE